MTETLPYLGLIPVINLQVAGFRVGQLMYENKLDNLVQPITY